MQKSFRHNLANPVIPAKEAVSISELYRLSLRGTRNNGNRNNRQSPIKQLLPLGSIGDDGIDHINFSRGATSQIGKLLSFESQLETKVPYAGRFRTMQNYWHFLKSPSHDDRFRNAQVAKLRSMYKAEEERAESNIPPVANFQALVVFGMYHRIADLPALSEGVRTIGLPFDLYSVTNEVRVRPSPASWLVPAMEVIREALVNHEEPNFFDFLDAKTKREFTGESKEEQKAYALEVIRHYFESEGIYKPKSHPVVGKESTDTKNEDVQQEGNDIINAVDSFVAADGEQAFAGGGAEGSFDEAAPDTQEQETITQVPASTPSSFSAYTVVSTTEEPVCVEEPTLGTVGSDSGSSSGSTD